MGINSVKIFRTNADSGGNNAKQSFIALTKESSLKGKDKYS
jgi:hypothetical protein